MMHNGTHRFVYLGYLRYKLYICTTHVVCWGIRSWDDLFTYYSRLVSVMNPNE